MFIVVIKSQDITCDSVNVSTCFINLKSVTCYRSNPCSVKCNSNYSNCVINILYEWNWEYAVDLHCPSENCMSCIVNQSANHSNPRMGYVNIYGYECSWLKIDMIGLAEGFIRAPGNGGTLILQSQHLYEVDIYSVNGTQNMIINLDDYRLQLSRHIYIDASYVEGYLNYTISGYASARGTQMVCNNICNIKCASQREAGGCIEMMVSAINGISSINWHCLEDESQCVNSAVSCSNIINELIWMEQYGWYFQSDDCIHNYIDWRTNPLSCTFVSDDTCYISRQTYPPIPQNITCPPKYKKCDIQISGGNIDPLVMNDWSHILCPSDVCEECKIRCKDDNSCSFMNIEGYNCSKLYVSTRSSEQKSINIYAPGNGGTLVYDIEGALYSNDLENINIYSNPGTYDIIIYSSKCWGCYHINIDGTFVTHELNVTCRGEDTACYHWNILCPTNAACNVFCGSISIACEGMSIFAPKGTHDVTWVCDGSDQSCFSATLQCDNGLSDWVYNKITETWDFNRTDCINPPTESPTAAPTNFTESPTQQTLSPTTDPTFAPIKEEWFEKIDMNKSEGITMVIGSILGFLLLLLIIICLVCICAHKREQLKREEKTMYISNGLVLSICIQHYDEKLCDDNCPDINGILQDLYGLEKDVENIRKIFEDELKYDIFYNNTDDDYVQTIWKKEEIKTFLEEKSNFLEDNIEYGQCYDGLIVIVSSHGVAPNLICTSDYGIYSQEEIHRIFSWTHPKSRNIPRLFIFDCCAGDFERINNPETGKHPNECDTKEEIKEDNEPWKIGEHNPDHRLAICNASNPGFQSKMNSKNGSYFIYEFCKLSMDNLKNETGRFVHEIFEDIQTNLHETGKQHPKYEWNDQTNYVRFKQQIALKDDEDKISSQHQTVELVRKESSGNKYSPVDTEIVN